MTTTDWLSGMEITAERLRAGITPTTITTGLVPATGFTVTGFSGYKIGALASIFATVSNTNAISMSGGNITPDVEIATLPDGWAPRDAINGVFGNGAMDGEFVILTDGTIQLRSAVANIAASTTLRLTTTYPFAT